MNWKNLYSKLNLIQKSTFLVTLIYVFYIKTQVCAGNYFFHYISFIRMFDFNQLVSEATRVISSSSTLIDQILSNTSEKICQFGTISLGLSDHCLIYATRKVVKGQINKHNTVKLKSLRNYCEQDFWLKLSAPNWQDVLTSTDVTKAWELFKEYFHWVLDVVAPIKDVKLKQRTKPWMTTDILQCIQKRDEWLILSFLMLYNLCVDFTE